MHLSRKVELAQQYIDLIAADEGPAEDVKAAMDQLSASIGAGLKEAAQRRADAAAKSAAEAQKLAE